MAGKNEGRFPPLDWLWREYERSAAWYSGDPARIRRAPAEGRSFWHSDEMIKLHVPIAADIAALSAGLIFSDSPVVTSQHAATRARLEAIMEEAGVYGVLLQAAELASAFGGVFLKWTWDVRDGCPRLTALPADAGLPEWRGGRLRRVTLWNAVREDSDGTIWRLEEAYEDDGHIRSRLLRGDAGELGAEVPLGSIGETRGIRPDADSGADALLAAYVPNLLPNHARPWSRFGRSDFDGLYGLFDALDEAYSAIQRETRMTKTTVIVPAEYLRRREEMFSQWDREARPAQWEFSNASGAFTALDIDSRSAASPIVTVNPEIRADGRIAVCDDLVRRILSLAGFAPQSDGLDISGSAESGTALTVRERKSLRTAEVKKTYWWHALRQMLRAGLRLDAAAFRSGLDPAAEFTVEMPGSAQPDIGQASEILERLERAGAISTAAKVRLLHPDWSDEEAEREARLIRLERNLPEEGDA